MNYYDIESNFRTCFFKEANDRPKPPNCNIGKFLPRSPSAFADWDLYRATERALDHVDYIDRRYFVMMSIGMTGGTRYKEHEAIAHIHRECLLNNRPYSLHTIRERFNKHGLIKHQAELVRMVEVCAGQ